MYKKYIALFLIFVLSIFLITPALADGEVASEVTATENISTESPFALTAKSAVLMEKSTGKILVEKNPDEKLPPASVTKIMSLILVMRALESGKIKLDDIVSVSEYAASMGGSQVYLEPGEQISVDDLIKAVTVASGNDATVALAEHISGSAEVFVKQMNETAKELGMNNTNFVNCTGLHDDNHYTTARDIAIMSRELLKHEDIKKYTLIWMDSLRNGEFGLSNTNKMVKTYKGITGLKTGSTEAAKFCISATAMRDNMELIAVVLGAPTSKERFEDAAKLLDYGFATYALITKKPDDLTPLRVLKGKNETVDIKPVNESFSLLVSKGSNNEIETRVEVKENVVAPVEENQKVGEIKYIYDGKEVGKTDIVTSESVAKESFFDVYTRTLGFLLMMGK